MDTEFPSEDGGCKKLACKCGWHGGGFLNTQPWCVLEHLGDTVYCPTSKSTHTHTHTHTHTLAHSESTQPYSGDESFSSYWCCCCFRSSIWHKSHSSLIPRWQGVAEKGPGFILSHREIRERGKSPQRLLFVHQWSPSFSGQEHAHRPSMINAEVDSIYSKEVILTFGQEPALSKLTAGVFFWLLIIPRAPRRLENCSWSCVWEKKKQYTANQLLIWIDPTWV